MAKDRYWYEQQSLAGGTVDVMQQLFTHLRRVDRSGHGNSLLLETVDSVVKIITPKVTIILRGKRAYGV